MTETSVGALYIAAVGPSMLVMALFMLVILVQVGLGGADRRTSLPRLPLAAKLRSLIDLVPTAILILVVLGTIYGGLATPTEAAALGVVGAMVFAAIEGKLSFRMLNTVGGSNRAQHRAARA